PSLFFLTLSPPPPRPTPFPYTTLFRSRLPGRCHEALVLNRPDVIQGVHESMLDAGAEVVETDTFQGSRLKLDEWGLGDATLEIKDRKSTRLNSSHLGISYAVFCLKKKK